MKRCKVQAQRKFAQGYMPPPPIDRRSEVHTSKDDDKSPGKDIIYTKMPVRNLLDIVSFGNIHMHNIQDVRVRVERLQENVVEGIENRRELHALEPPARPPPPAAAPPARKRPPPSPGRKFRNKSTRMQLRSRVSKVKKPTRLTNTIKKAISNKVNKKIVPVQISPVLKKRSDNLTPKRNKSPILSEFSTDDDIPLNLINKKINVTNLRKRKRAVPKAVSLRQDNSNNKKTKGDQPKKDATKTPVRNVCVQTVAEPSPKEKASGNQLKSKEASAQTQTEEQEMAISIIGNESITEQPPPSDDSNIKLYYSESTDKEGSSTVTSLTNKSRNNSFYGRNEIEKWIVDSADCATLDPLITNLGTLPESSNPVRPANETYHEFKVPEPRPLKNTDRNKSNRKARDTVSDVASVVSIDSISTRGSNCPSVQYTTPESIKNVTPSEINNMCRSCDDCDRMRKLIQVFSIDVPAGTSLIELSENTSITIEANKPHDVYSFTDTDSNQDQPAPRFRRPNVEDSLNNTHLDEPAVLIENTTAPDSGADGQHLYFNLLNNHAIELLSLKLPNESRAYMTARLIPRPNIEQTAETGEVERDCVLREITDRSQQDHIIDEMLADIAENTRPPNTDNAQNSGTSVPTESPNNPGTSSEQPETNGLQKKNKIFKSKTRRPVATSSPNSANNNNTTDPKPTENTTTEKQKRKVSSGATKDKGKSTEPRPSTSSESVQQSTANVSVEKVTKSASKQNIGKKQKNTVSNEGQRQSLDKAKSTTVGIDTSSRKSQTSSSGDMIKSIVNSKLLDAPVFKPTASEFENPIAYIQKITPQASKYGLCKIVPPKGFNPECHVDDTTRFTATNQYPGKMFSRWGPATRELSAIRAHLATQKVLFTRPPLIDSIEVNLPQLYHIVQSMGGLTKVIEKKKWQRVADEMHYPRGKQVEKKLDQAYVKYLLPYDALTNRERQEILADVECKWNKRYKKMLERAQNPLQKQKVLLGESSEPEEEEEDEADEAAGALDEVDDCVLVGRTMNVATFKKIASKALSMHFPSLSRAPTPEEVEASYWRLVVLGSEHVCVNSAAVDTGEQGYGFTKNKADPYSKHPWNPKVLSNSPGSMLRSLGPVLSVTVPTLHLGMVYSTSCWHRDPHGLPWIEYMHEGPPKIWYGIPDEQSDRFRKAVIALCPAFCQNKAIWLASDITMIPPNLLMEHDVSLAKLVQNPGEFVVIFPKAYSSSICTGYTVSESVYYAPLSWLTTVMADFQEVRGSCEPTMFSLEQLLIATAGDSRAPPSVLPAVHRALEALVRDEANARRALINLNLKQEESRHPPKKKHTAWNVRELEECDVCRTTLFLSKVVGLTDRKSAHCLQHAVRLLEGGRGSPGDAHLVSYYSQQALLLVLDKLSRRLFNN